MSKEEASKPAEKASEAPSTEVSQSDAPQAQPQNVSLSLEQLQSIVSSAVDSALKGYQTAEGRKRAEEYNSKIAEVVQTSQATIMKPTQPTSFDAVKYVENVFTSREVDKRKHPEGKGFYSDDSEGLLRSKIVILKKMGLTNEQIAEEIKDLLI